MESNRDCCVQEARTQQLSADASRTASLSYCVFQELCKTHAQPQVKGWKVDWMFSSHSLKNDYFVRYQKIISSWTSGITVIIEPIYQFEMDIKLLSLYSMTAHPIQFNMCEALLYLHNKEIKQYTQLDWKAGKALTASKTAFLTRLCYSMHWLSLQHLVLIST